MKLLNRLNYWLMKIESFILSAGILLMALILIINVLSRNIFNYSLSFVEEVSQFLVIIVTFVGMSTAARFSRNINMNALIDNMPFKLQKVMVLVMAFFTSATMTFLGVVSVQYMRDIYRVQRISTTLGWPMWIIVAFVATGFFLTSFQFALTFLNTIVEKKNYFGAQAYMNEEKKLVTTVDFNEFDAEKHRKYMEEKQRKTQEVAQ